MIRSVDTASRNFITLYESMSRDTPAEKEIIRYLGDIVTALRDINLALDDTNKRLELVEHTFMELTKRAEAQHDYSKIAGYTADSYKRALKDLEKIAQEKAGQD